MYFTIDLGHFGDDEMYFKICFSVLMSSFILNSIPFTIVTDFEYNSLFVILMITSLYDEDIFDFHTLPIYN